MRIKLKLKKLILLTIFLIVISSSVFYFLIKNPMRNQRLLCMVTTQPIYHSTRAEAVKSTWAQKCDALYFVSSESDPYYPTVGMKCDKETHSHLWCKNRKGLIYGYENFINDFDWFLKTDDDTYVIIENLKHLLSGYDSNEALIFGMPFKYQNTVYPSGGAGYVSSMFYLDPDHLMSINLKIIHQKNLNFMEQIFSKEAITRLVHKLTDDKTDRIRCHTRAQEGADDLDIGRCLEGLDIEFVDTRDQFGRGRFFPFQPYWFLNPKGNIYQTIPWFKNYSTYLYKSGSDCCSDYAISFHYIFPPDMYALHYFVYQFKLKN